MIQFNRFKDGKQHCLTFSYDDGITADEQLIDIFNRYGMKGTFHLNSGFLDTENRINSKQVRNLYQGHEIACHSLTHPFPDRIPIIAWTQEIWEDRVTLEQLSSGIVRGLSYPNGSYNNEVIAAAKSCGIVYSRTTIATENFTLPKDFLMWHPTCHHHTCMECADRFFQPWNWNNCSQLFYIWGHSYEFDRENNWNLMEEFCKKLADNEKIWYATNIEIYDYIQALNCLQISANQKRLYNPNAQPLWVSCNEETVKIGGGETVNL